MYHIIALGSFGPCYVQNKITATANREDAILFYTEEEATRYRDKYWPMDEVTTYIAYH